MKILAEKEAEEFLEKEGFPIVKRRLVKSLDQIKSCSNEIGYPIVLKNPDLLHKTEKNGVIMNVMECNLEEAYNNLLSSNPKLILVQKQIEGIEIVVGLKKDPTFGHVVALGIGGIFTEAIKDVSFRVCPIKKEDVLEMIKELRTHEIFEGFRGKKINVESIISIVLKVCELSKKYPSIKELDINPLIVKEEATIVDARVIFE